MKTSIPKGTLQITILAQINVVHGVSSPTPNLKSYCLSAVEAATETMATLNPQYQKGEYGCTPQRSNDLHNKDSLALCHEYSHGLWDCGSSLNDTIMYPVNCSHRLVGFYKDPNVKPYDANFTGVFTAA